MNYKCLSEIYKEENQFYREKLQYLFDKSIREKDENLLRILYVSLRQLQFSENFNFETEQLELTSLAESLTVACDILASPSGISFIFCGGDICHIEGNQKLISKALLNLLSNAYLYGKENLVTVKTVRTDTHSRLEVLSGGAFTNINPDGKGLSFVRQVCDTLHGSFFIEQTLTHTKTIMTFKNTEHSDIPLQRRDTDIISLLSDRLSPACIEMFGMEYH